MKKSSLTAIFLLIFSAAYLYAGGNREVSNKPASGKLQIAATTSIITDVVKNIAGEHADVTGLVPRGQDPHGYEPKPRQIAGVENADIVFVNGFELEEQILEIVEKTAAAKIVEVSEGIDAIEPDEHDGDEGEDHHQHDADPHTWMSLRNVKIWVLNIERSLSAADPEHSSDYRVNAKAYTEKLDALDVEVSGEFEGIPEENKLILTDHDMFGYLARDYGFSVSGTILPSLSTNSEASAKHIADLVQLIRLNNINAVFIGASSSEAVGRLAATLTEESGRNVKILSILTGSLSSEGTRGDTYLDFFRYNAEQIVKGLKS